MKTILYIVKIDYKEFIFTNSTSAVNFATTALQSASTLSIYDIAIELKIVENLGDSETLGENEKGGDQNASCI